MARAKVVRRARHTAKRYFGPVLGPVSRLAWREPLDRLGTLDLLEDYRIDVNQDSAVPLPVLDPDSGVRPRAFSRDRVEFEPEYVWRVATGGDLRSIRITPSGTVLLNDKHLVDLDFGSWPGILDRPGKLHAHDVGLAIAPWSHPWAAYYDYLMFVIAKLCRIKDVLDEEAWNTAKVCYPTRRKRFEGELLEKLGLNLAEVVDTRSGSQLRANTVVVSNIQHNWLPSPSSVRALRRHMLHEMTDLPAGRRIYLPRARTRRVTNEHDVLRLLVAHGFESIEDQPRSIDDQIMLFRSASIIIAPHGSSLANLVWCDPGTQVVELFSASFTWAYYYYLCRLIGLGYSYLVDDSTKPSHWSNTEEDMSVDMQALEGVLQRIT